MALRSVWNLYNLSESPFFPDPLRAGDGILSSSDAVNVGHADDTDTVCVRILGDAYEAIVSNGDFTTRAIDAIDEARQVVRWTETRLNVARGMGRMRGVGLASRWRSLPPHGCDEVRPSQVPLVEMSRAP